jgi:hypothetical protein
MADMAFMFTNRQKDQNYIQTDEPFFIIGDLPDLPPGNYVVHPGLICAQMIQTNPFLKQTLFSTPTYCP